VLAHDRCIHISIANLGDELQAFVNSLRSVTDDQVRSALGQKFRQHPGLVNRLMQFVATLEDGVEDIDDPDADEDEDNRKPADRGAAIDACKQLVSVAVKRRAERTKAANLSE
jgi:hypothetical protein